MTNAEWLNNYKVLELRPYICRHNRPLLSAHLHGNCAVELLQPGRSVSSICDRRIVELYNFILVQLDNNEWIHFIPSTDSITATAETRNLLMYLWEMHVNQA